MMRVEIYRYSFKGKLKDTDVYFGVENVWYQSQEYIKNGRWLNLKFINQAKAEEQGFIGMRVSIQIEKNDDFAIYED